MFVLRTDYAAIGRPVIFGLVFNSNIGVERVLELYIQEFKTTMYFCGVYRIFPINKN